MTFSKNLWLITEIILKSKNFNHINMILSLKSKIAKDLRIKIIKNVLKELKEQYLMFVWPHCTWTFTAMAQIIFQSSRKKLDSIK